MAILVTLAFSSCLGTFTVRMPPSSLAVRPVVAAEAALVELDVNVLALDARQLSGDHIGGARVLDVHLEARVARGERGKRGVEEAVKLVKRPAAKSPRVTVVRNHACHSNHSSYLWWAPPGAPCRSLVVIPHAPRIMPGKSNFLSVTCSPYLSPLGLDSVSGPTASCALCFISPNSPRRNKTSRAHCRIIEAVASRPSEST